jgi:hypothetical protein
MLVLDFYLCCSFFSFWWVCFVVVVGGGGSNFCDDVSKQNLFAICTQKLTWRCFLVGVSRASQLVE